MSKCACVLVLFGSLFSLLAQTPTKSLAKPDYSQEAFVVEQDSTRITFEADSTGTRESGARVRIQSDAGVQRFGLLTFSYQNSTESMDIDYVRVRKPDGTTVVTPPENIQDMASDITREAPFYSDVREKHVAVKGLGTGDVLEYQVHWLSTKPLVPGQFWFAYNFSDDVIELQQQLQISVPRERPVKWKSPDLKPSVTEEGVHRVFTWTTSNTVPKSSEQKQKDQERNAFQAARGQFPPPDVQISSFQSWEELGHWYGTLQQERVQPSPEIRAKAAELTKGAADDAAKLHALYNYVSTQFRYIGIAFGIGRYQPHSAAEILSNQYGDCKDKHTLLASLLQAAGITAYPALISTRHQLDPDVPSPGQFDHVITAVPQGKDFLWLDTTAELGSFAYLVTPLRDKQALVIPGDNPPLLLATPVDPPFKTSLIFKAEGKLSAAGILDARMEQSAHGDLELILRTMFRRVPQSQWKELVQNISYGSGFGGTVSEIVASSPEATDSPFRFTYNYSRNDYSDWENHRITPPFPPVMLPPLKDDQTKFSQPLWLGAPGESALNAQIGMPKGYTPELPRAVDLTRDFAEYHASYGLEHGVLIATRRLVVKLHQVPIEQFQEYKSFRKGVNDDQQRYIILASGAPLASDAVASFQNKIWDLPNSDNPKAVQAVDEARDAMLQANLQGAIAALQHAVALDPKFTRGWVLLGSTLMSSRQANAGLEALRKAVDSDPKQTVPRHVLGFALMSMHKYEDAVTLWQETIRISPDDSDAAANLGGALVYLKRYSEAASALESAVKLSPQGPNLQFQLGSAYLGAGNEEKSMAAFHKAIELDSEPAMLNSVAYELADANKKLSESLDYAQKAVQEEEDASQKVNLAELELEDLHRTSNLANYWDTLGWVHFRLGKLEQAERYLEAAWTLSQRAEEGDHLGQVYEQQHKKQAAIHMYQLALAASVGARPGDNSAEKVRQHLQYLGVNPATPAQGPNTGGAELSQMRTIKLSRLVPGQASGEFFLLFAPGPKVEDVKFIKGSDKLKAVGKALVSAKFDIPFPDGGPTRLVRRAVLGCFPTTGCTLVLLPPDLVYSVN